MGAQLSLFAPPVALPVTTPTVEPYEAFRTQPHSRLDHPEITADHVAWISHGGQVCVETRSAGESDEAWCDRAWPIVVRWDAARAYSGGVCVWDSRDIVRTDGAP